ncbi:MAG: glycosyltransferase family 1 protein [Muribaculaceae bacterium]|nr:glycosyltransferase family 1 protein [Muribaculaceae bacterium]
MRIGYDAKRALFNNTGLGNYSRLVVDVLSEYYKENEYLLFTPRIVENSRLAPLLERDNVSLVAPKGFNIAAIWRSYGITRDAQRANIDLFHGLSGELPLNILKSGIPSIVTIHDLIFHRFPEYYKPIDVKIYTYKFRKACLNATRIIAISECTKRDIISYYGIDEAKIDVVYQGCDKQFSQPIEESRLKETAIQNQLPAKFILYVGTIEERKNLMVILKSMSALPKDIHLVVVGRPTAYIETVKQFIRNAGITSRVHFYHEVPFVDLPAFYRLASVFVYPSRFEGFGIPLLEALSSGVPAIGATGSCLEEAGGESTLYINPDDSGSLTSAILRILKDEKLRVEMIANGLEYAQKFNSRIMAQDIMKIYEKVLRNRS